MHSRIDGILAGAGVQYQERRHSDVSVVIDSPQDFAAALGFEIGRIAKTLLLCTPAKDHFCLAVLSCNKRLNMKLVAALEGVNRLHVASKDMLAEVLSYPPTGVSPFGAATIPVLMDEELMRYDTVLVGGGEVGVEIEISPRDVKLITNAKVLRLSP
jgi:Cys-tRNA(Pro)/Cys-tRNA(Cys) deacylase